MESKKRSRKSSGLAFIEPGQPLILECRSYLHAETEALQRREYWAGMAVMLQSPKVVIRYPNREGKRFEVSAAMASSSMLTVNPKAVTQIQQSAAFYRSARLPVVEELLSVMGQMIEADRPMFLLSNDTDDQLWINQIACDMIQSNGADAVRRCMRNYWNAPDLEALHQKLRDTTQPFEHNYRAILNDEQSDVWFEATSRYEPIEINGRSFRLSVNQDFRIIGRQADLAPMRHT